MMENIFNKTKKNKRPAKLLKHKLTVSFTMSAVILMGILWLMQAVFLGKYYEMSMSRRCSSSLATIYNLYTNSETLSYDDFVAVIGDVSTDGDIYFKVEAADMSFIIDSTDESKQGRLFLGTEILVRDARTQLADKDNGEQVCLTNFSPTTQTSNIVYATKADNKNFMPIYIYAITSLTPLGPAVEIIRNQLLIVTVIALVLSWFISRWLSKRLSKPIVAMGEQAKELAKGNYDINFEGGHQVKEVDELAEILTETAAELKKSDALQKDLMANVSHDLRTPLTMIKSYAEMIRDLSGDIPEKRDQHLNVIIEETDRLSELVNDVLTLSKMQAGVTEFDMADFDLQKAAESVLSTYMVMENEGYKFNMVTLSEDVIINGDEHRIKQVIANLLSNAVRYSSEKKEITVAFNKVSDNVVRLSVADTGIGIAKEDLEKIWHRYEKASSQGQRTQSGGTGLGLSIASEILERHNAHYGVTSKVNEGSTFWFEMNTR